jgi:methionyl-tRNA synthetase
MEPIILTTAISYPNGDPHIGHWYEIILADFYCRYLRLVGEQVFFQTGTDEHGQKMADKAAELGLSPQALCDQNSAKFREMANLSGSSYDHFIRTTDPHHKNIVRQLFEQLQKQDDIYLGSYTGWYNQREETFVAEHDAKLSNYKDPMTNLALRRIDEPSYFFRLCKYLPRVLSFLEASPDFIVPSVHYNEICQRLRNYCHSGKESDLSISRVGLKWGISVPNDADHCLYVWMDALLNYYTGPEGKGIKTQECRTIHIIGKDILWFHAVIWPAFLLALGLRLPEKIYVHDFIVDKNGLKMSKSLANVVDARTLLTKPCGLEGLRFFLLKETTPGFDLRFSESAFEQAIISELASKLGNVVNRVLSLTGKYVDGKVPAEAASCVVFPAAEDYENILAYVHKFDSSSIVMILQSQIHKINQHLMQTEIWKIKTDDVEGLKKIPGLLRAYLEGILIIGWLWGPVLPDVSKKICGALRYDVGSSLLPTNYWRSLKPGVEVEKSLILFKVK